MNTAYLNSVADSASFNYYKNWLVPEVVAVVVQISSSQINSSLSMKLIVTTCDSDERGSFLIFII